MEAFMWFNPIMTWILKSPFHKMMSDSTMLVTVIGCKTGRLITTPVNYIRDGKTLWVASDRDRTWWRNLIGGKPMTVTIARKTQPALGEVILHEKESLHAMTEYFKLAPHMAKYFKVKLDQQGNPNKMDLAAAAHKQVMIQITLS